MSKWCVYKHTFPCGKSYIGITSKPPEERWDDGFGYETQRRLFAEIVRSGWENIEHEVLREGLDEAKARKIETNLIREAWQENKENSLNTQCYLEKKNRKPKNPDNSWRKLHRKPLTYWSIGGISKPAREWCEDYETSYSCVVNRMKKQNLTLEQALKFPPVPHLYRKRPLEYWESLGLLV